MPASTTVNGNPFVQPVSFGIGRPEYALNPTLGRNAEADAVAVGDLIQVQANNYAVLASASDSIEANGAVSQILTANTFYWSIHFQMWLTVSGGATSEHQQLWLGDDGAFTVTRPTEENLQQVVGFTSRYRASDGKHLVTLIPRPAPVENAILNDSGGTVTSTYLYGRDTDGTVQIALSGASPIPPRFVALSTVANGAVFPVKVSGQARVKAELSGAYVVNSPAYVSGSVAGKVTRARPSGYAYKIGSFAETARDADETILVDLDIQHTAQS